MNNRPLIALQGITVRLRERWYLQHTSWQIRSNEQWVILGPNGSGKTTLARALAGEIPIVQGRRLLGDAFRGAPKPGCPIAIVSADQPARILAREAQLFQSRSFAGRFDEFTRARSVLCQDLGPVEDNSPESALLLETTCGRLNLAGLLDHPIESLSSGELRKLLLVRALLQKPRLLILDEPFNSLDQGSKAEMAALIAQLTAEGRHIVLITHRMEEILPVMTHILLLRDGKVQAQGPRDEILNGNRPTGFLRQPMANESSLPDDPLDPDRRAAESPAPTPPCESCKTPGTLVEMTHVSVSYASTPVLRDFSWTMRHGENWAILGPNGAGKSTVLALIAGDHLQAYANQIRLFGRQRGSGESIWEIKRHIGFISPGLHARYHKRMSAFDVVCSGFFDSIGLYRLCSAKQIDKAEQWVKALDLGDLSPLPFQELSHGQRQLVLIGRAMVKSPLLLILDEPCEGLDKAHRHRLLAMLDTIGRQPNHHLIYVTHHPSELPGCITHVLKLKEGRIESKTDGF